MFLLCCHSPSGSLKSYKMGTHFEAKNKLFRFSWQVLFSAISETGNFRGILVNDTCDWCILSILFCWWRTRCQDAPNVRPHLTSPISRVRFGAGYRATMEDLSGQWLRSTIYQLKQLKIATSISGFGWIFWYCIQLWHYPSRESQWDAHPSSVLSTLSIQPVIFHS